MNTTKNIQKNIKDSTEENVQIKLGFPPFLFIIFLFFRFFNVSVLN